MRERDPPIAVRFFKALPSPAPFFLVEVVVKARISVNSEQYKKIKEIFFEACNLEPEKQRKFLDQVCGGDAELLAGVEDLLKGDQAAGAPLDVFSPKQELHRLKREAGQEPLDEKLPERIGRYHIVRMLGEGGMGVVCEAEQERPRRTVALKIIQEGMASSRLRRRFEFEAEVLGQLQHPGIAQIYEAGVSDAGQHFFAMELIRGSPLTEYARLKRLSIQERLELVSKVCDAVHHAHQKGVIHRDLKPGNILVDEKGQPKILDFGVARLTESDVQTATLQTDIGQIIGTLPYMSPEQASGDSGAIDIRSDVYSLGVILYELLSGRLPHELGSKPLPEALRAIREDEPSRITTASKIFRGDIDTILAKSLEKEKERRYQSAAELAADLRRHLNHEPIVARRTSVIYQLRKFAQRNTALVCGVVVAFIAMLVGTIVSLWLAAIAVHQSDLADKKTELALLEAYRARLAAADAAIGANDPVAVEEQLNSIGEDRRQWEWRYWWSRSDRSIALLDAGHPVAGAAFNEDGTQVVAAYGNGRLIRWNCLEGKEMVSQQLDSSPIHIAKFDLSGTRMAAVFGSDRKAMGLWNTVTGKKLAEIKGLDAPCHSLAITPDGQKVVGASMEQAAWILDGASSKVIQIDNSKIIKSAYSRPIAFYQDASQFVLGGYLGWLGLFDLDTGKCERVENIATNHILCLRFSKDGSRIVIGEGDNWVYLGDVRAKKAISKFRGHTTGVSGVAFSPDEKRLASAGDRTVRLWDISSDRQIAVLTGHSDKVMEVAFSPDGSRLLSISLDRTVRLWDSRPEVNLSVLKIPDSYAPGLALSPDGKRVFSVSWHGNLLVWDVASGVCLGDMFADHPKMIRNSCVAVASPEGRYCASGRSDGWLSLWDAGTGMLVATMKCHQSYIFGMAFSPDGSHLATSSDDSTVRLWSIPSMAESSKKEEKFDLPGGLAVSPDGKLLAVGAGKAVQILHARTLEEIASFQGHTQRVHCVAFSPDGSLLASGSEDQTIRLWDPGTGKLLGLLTGHNGIVLDLAFSPDASRLASGSGDAIIRIWDLRALVEVTRLRGHTGNVYSLEFTHDGKKLISTGADGTVRIWDTVPQRMRWQARERRLKLLEEVEPLISRLFSELKEPRRIVEKLREDKALGDEERDAALQLTFMRSIKK